MVHGVFSGAELAVFDLDGTLVDSAADIAYSANVTIERHGLRSLTIAEVVPLIGRPAGEIFVAAGCTDEDVDGLVVEFRTHLREHVGERSTVYPGVVELLESLRGQGLRCAVATTKPTSLAAVAVERAGLLALFDHVQGTDGVPPKPDPTVVRMCLDEFGASSGVMIGDTPDDVHAGRAAGLATVGLLHGTRTEAEVRASQPDVVMTRIGDLLHG